MEEGNTPVNVLIGAAVTVVTANFIPMSPVAGGAVSAYLEKGERTHATKVGAYSGAVAFIPTLLFGLLFAGLFGAGFFVSLVSGDTGGGIGSLLAVVFTLFVLAFTVVYFVGGGAAGGWIAHYVENDTDINL